MWGFKKSPKPGKGAAGLDDDGNIVISSGYINVVNELEQELDNFGNVERTHRTQVVLTVNEDLFNANAVLIFLALLLKRMEVEAQRQRDEDDRGSSILGNLRDDIPDDAVRFGPYDDN